MPWSVNNVPPSAKNLTKPQKKKFAEIANAILATGADEGLAIATAMKEAKKIKKSIDILKTENKDNFIYATVYEQNLWVHKISGKKFTVCKGCDKPVYIEEAKGVCCPYCDTELGDYHNEFAQGFAVEKACWEYLKGITEKANKTTEALKVIQKVIDGESEIEITDILKVLKNNKYHVGYGHSIFDKSIGYPVENHCLRETIEVFDDEYEKVTWKSGFIVDDYVFNKCINGDIVGFSFGGSGNISPLQENIDE